MSLSLSCKTFAYFWRQRNTAGSNPIWIFLHLVLSLFSLIDNPCPTDSYLLCVMVKILVNLIFADLSIKPTMLCTTMYRHFVFVGYICVSLFWSNKWNSDLCMEDVLLFMPSIPFHTFVRLSFAINVSVSVYSFNPSNAKYLTYNNLLLCSYSPTWICKLQVSLSHLMLQLW